jgi:hypothetical protein
VVREDLYKCAGNDIGVEIGHASKSENSLSKRLEICALRPLPRHPPVAKARRAGVSGGTLAVGKEGAAGRGTRKVASARGGPT